MAAAAAMAAAAVAAAAAATAPRTCLASLRSRGAPRLVLVTLAQHVSPGARTDVPTWVLSWQSAAVAALGVAPPATAATDFLALHDLSLVTVRDDGAARTLSCRLAPDRLHVARYCGGLLQLDLAAPPASAAAAHAPPRAGASAGVVSTFAEFVDAVCAAARALAVPVQQAAAAAAAGISPATAAQARIAAASAPSVAARPRAPRRSSR